MSGQPAISLPLHWNADGLPIGVQLVAAYGREDVLIRVAAQLEAAHPWADRHPEAVLRGWLRRSARSADRGRQRAVQPPSTIRLWPVMNEPARAGEQQQRAVELVRLAHPRDR